MPTKPPTKRGTPTRGGRKRTMSAPTPAPAVPGTMAGFGNYPPVDGKSTVANIANSPEAMHGRISYSAGPSLTRYSTYPADGISAEGIKSAMRQSDLGYPRLQAEMYEQVIERDAHLRGVAKARIYEVSGKPWRIQPSDETELASRVAKFCRGAIDAIDGFDSDIDDLLWANGNGYAASEIVWAFDSIRIPLDRTRSTTITALVPSQLDWVHAKHFEFDAITDEPYLVMTGGRIHLPPNKFVFHGAADTGFYERRGYMRPCLTLHAAKAWALRDWLLYEALFAVPQVTGTYPAGNDQYELQRETYQAIMRDWGKGVPAFISDEIDFKIGAAQSGGSASGVQGAILGYCNQEISKLVQGETLTTEVGNVGAYAATETHADVRHAFIRADARKLARTLHDQLLTSIVTVNLDVLSSALGAPPTEILRCVPGIKWTIDRETSPSQRVTNLIALSNAGVPIGLDQVYDECGIDPPREGAPLLKGDPITVAAGGATIGSAKAADGHEHDDEAALAKVDVEAAKVDGEESGALPVKGATQGKPAPASAPAQRIELTATDRATYVTVNEARAGDGLPPLASDDGLLTVAEFKAKHAGPIAEAAQAESGKDPDDDPPDDDPTGMHRFDAGNFKESDHPRKGGKFAPKGGGDGGAKAKQPKPDKPAKSDKGGTGKGSSAAVAPHRPDDGSIEWAIESAVRKHFAPAAPDADSNAPAKSADAPAKPAKIKPFKLKLQRAPRVKPPADPNAPEPAPRIYHRDHLGRFRVAPQPGDNAAQLTLPTKLPTVKKDGKVKVDPAKVPGGGKGYKVRVTNNPEAGYKGRSFVMNSIADGLAEFMATPCQRPDIEGYQGDQQDGWTNGQVLEAVMGKGYGDATIWKDLADAVGSKITGLESAFAALTPPRRSSVVMRAPKAGDKVVATDAKGNKIKGWLGAPDPKTGAVKVYQVEGSKSSAVEVQPKSVTKPHGGKDRAARDFRDFRLDTLQAAHPAFAVLAQPAWLDEHANDQQVATYYQEQAESAKAYQPPASSDSNDDLPYYGGEEKYQSYSHNGDASDVPF